MLSVLCPSGPYFNRIPGELSFPLYLFAFFGLLIDNQRIAGGMTVTGK